MRFWDGYKEQRSSTAPNTYQSIAVRSSQFWRFLDAVILWDNASAAQNNKDYTLRRSFCQSFFWFLRHFFNVSIIQQTDSCLEAPLQQVCFVASQFYWFWSPKGSCVFAVSLFLLPTKILLQPDQISEISSAKDDRSAQTWKKPPLKNQGA